ncbi:hypothetical protein ACMFMG_006978 [Clarireedia jacksonii]
MYWVVLAIALFAESWVGFILVWIPFYSWIRLGFLLYLILPQTQGARVLYQTHVHPWLHNNELAIDEFISSTHDRAKAAGVEYLKQAIEMIKQHVFGLPPKEPTPPPTPSAYSYTQNLMARFNLPSARSSFPSNPLGGASSTANDFYSLLASAVSAATSSNTASGGAEPHDLSNSGTLIPPTVAGHERISFIEAQRERLTILLSALDKEAQNLQSMKGTPRNISSMSLDSRYSEADVTRPKSSMSGLSSRKSEPDFEKIDAESGSEEAEATRRAISRTTSGNWIPWSWATHASGAKSADKGRSSGVDA